MAVVTLISSFGLRVEIQKVWPTDGQSSPRRTLPLLDVENREFVRGRCSEVLEFEQAFVQQVRRHHVGDSPEDGLEPTGILAIPGLQHVLDHLALQVVLRTTQVTGDDRKLRQRCVLGDILLTTIRQRPDDNVMPSSSGVLEASFSSCHRRTYSEITFQNVIPVMPQCNFGHTMPTCVLVEYPPAKP